MSSNSLYRADKAFPDHWRWRIFALPEIPENDLTGPFGTELETGGRRIAGQTLEFPPSGQILLSDFSEDAPAFLLVCDFTESGAGKAVIGVGADWRLVLKINGTVLCDTRKTGNGEIHYEADDHKLEFSYPAGANQLSMLVICGRSSRLAAARLFPAEHPALKHPPWCAFPDSRTGSVRITFTTTLPCPAGIDFREKGSEEWRRVYDSTGGRINRQKTVHQIRLGGLVPDREYEYRTVLLDELVRWEEIVGTEIHHFRTLPDSDRVFRFNFTADLQVSGEKIREFAQQMKKQEADFTVFAGDPVWTSDFERDYLERTFLPLAEAAAGKPMVAVRGNHEMYGKDTERFFDYFSAPPELGREGYYAFRCGEVCFTALDFCDDEGRCPWPSTRMLHDIEPYLEQEERWLRELVKQPFWREAKWRIVLAHALPAGDFKKYLPDHVREMIDPLFGGDPPQYRIHLWLGGHIHYAMRSIPGQNRIRSAVPPEERYPDIRADIRKYPFPVAAVSGPSRLNPPGHESSFFTVRVEPDKITVKAFDNTGKQFDHFAVAPSGEVIEEQPDEFFRLRELPLP